MAAFEVRQLPGRGQGLVAARDLEPGEEVLADAPLLLTAAPEARSAVCAACLRALGAGAEQCGNCWQAAFCSPACAAAARSQPEVHSPYVCSLLARAAGAGLGGEEVAALAFLAQVSALQAAAAAGDAGAACRLSALAALATGLPPEVPPPASAAAAHAALTAAATAAGQAVPQMSLQEAGRLLALEQRVSYGVMAPSGQEGERRVRGGGIYPTASLLNHECLPNVARFDDFDGAAPAPANTVVRFRALHAIPKGEELTQSYFPLVWDLEERAAACAEQYGFTCTCPRCQVEASWDDAGSDAMSDGGQSGGGEGAEQQEAGASSGEQEPAAAATPAGSCTDEYIQLFLLKFVCPTPECFGTMAPVRGADASQCSMCARTRTEAEFMAEVQSYG